jgi:LPXTG-motif cell wall-anchored protein
MKKFALAILASVAMVLGMGAVANADYPPDAGSVTVNPVAPSAGAEFTVTATCETGEIVTFVFEGETKTATCGATTASVTFTAPTAVGTYSGTATGSDNGDLGSFSITIAAPATPGSGLPATGTDGTSTMAIIAIGLLLVGAGLFSVSRLRSRALAA